MPANSIAETSFLASLADMVLLDRVLVIGPTGFGIRKQPILLCPVIALSMSKQDFHESRIDGNAVPGIFRLNVRHLSVDHAPLNEQGAVLEIEIRPLQRHDLACPESKASGDPDLGRVGLG